MSLRFWKIAPEGPERINTFLQRVQSLKWDDENQGKPLQSLFDEINTLMQYEIQYYFRVSRRDGFLSVACRCFIILFGGLGFLMPLIENAGYLGVGKFGFLSFGIAGMFVAANNVFGASTSHARYITTQFHLEQLVSEKNILWHQQKCMWDNPSPSKEQIAASFKIIQVYSEEAYKLIIAETTEWSEVWTKAIADYAKTLKG
jgi:hypothetical protein